MEKYMEVEAGVFIGPQPTKHDLAAARQGGIRTVVDMRMPDETGGANAELVTSAGMNYFNVPVDKTALSCHAIDELERIMGTMERPALIHCATGARVALMLSLGRSLKHGWNAERTFDEARGMGFDIQESANFAAFVGSSIVPPPASRPVSE